MQHWQELKEQGKIEEPPPEEDIYASARIGQVCVCVCVCMCVFFLCVCVCVCVCTCVCVCVCDVFISLLA